MSEIAASLTRRRSHRGRWSRREILVRSGLALAAFLVACGGEPAGEGTVVVNMYDNAYSPPVVRIPSGGRVRFRNLGRNQHHAVALDESWSTAESFGSFEMERGTSAEVVFEADGVYRFYCTFHGSPLGDRGMVGVVVVGDAAYDPAGPDAAEPVLHASGRVVRVPEDQPTVQAGVDAARPGDLVLVGRGVYSEAVTVTTPSIVLRGVDRNEVVLDGRGLWGNGVLVLADGVAVENLTVRNYLLNGVYWTGVTGYRGAYLTAHANGDYGVYAFDSTDGLIERSYASGSPDAGFYVGQCYPCRAVLRYLVSERNGLGYSGTNAGGDLYLVESVWRRNMGGIVPNTLDSELFPPERETTVAGNVVAGNSNREAPSKGIVYPALGTGILVAGGVANRIERNLVTGHEGYGILLLPSADRRFWPARGNVVRENEVRASGRADLALGWPGTPGNCFAGNRFATATPPGLERLVPCDGPRWPLAFDPVPAATALLRQRRAARGALPGGAPGDQPEPPRLGGLPGGADAPVVPAVDVFARLEFDLEAIERPRSEGELLGRIVGAGELEAISLDATPATSPPAGSLQSGRSVAWLPAAVAVLWWLAAGWDLLRRRDLSRRARAGWGLAAIVPWVGAAGYLAAKARWGWGVRAAAILGPVLAWLVVVVAIALRQA